MIGEIIRLGEKGEREKLRWGDGERSDLAYFAYLKTLRPLREIKLKDKEL